MREILPAVFHWTAKHPKIGFEVSSYWLKDERVMLDPLLPADEVEVLDRLHPEPENILLTNRHHYRDSGALADRFGCTVWCVESGLHEFEHGETVRPFAFGDVLPGGFEAIEIGVLCPDETALLLGGHGGVLAVADGVVRHEDGPLSFVPDEYLGDDPPAIKERLKQSYRPLLEREFDNLFLAHGLPVIGGAREALRQFVES